MTSIESKETVLFRTVTKQINNEEDGPISAVTYNERVKL